jgi:hypothetical protein
MTFELQKEPEAARPNALHKFRRTCAKRKSAQEDALSEVLLGRHQVPTAVEFKKREKSC